MNRESEEELPYIRLRVTTYTHQGDRTYNEDKIAIVYQKEDNGHDLKFAYFGVFDGHGGDSASNFARRHLHNFILNESKFWSDKDEDVFESFRIGFNKCQMAMWGDLDNWPQTASGLPSTAGTTASIAFIRKKKLYIAHCGDSGITCGLSNYDNNLVADMLTTDHKPECEPEYSRIIAAGGKIAKKGVAEVHRVVWFRPKTKQRGPIRRNTPVDEIPFLAVARSLGDLWSYNVFTNEFVVSPEPDTYSFNLNTKVHKCLILATDGLWNSFDHHRAVHLFNVTDNYNKQYAGRSWKNPSQYLVESALQECRNKNMRADNITVICIALEGSNDGPLRAIYDHDEKLGYNLDIMDANARYPYLQQLPPFEDVAHGSQQRVYPNLQRPSFVNACCHQSHRFVLAEQGEVVAQHYDEHHHRIEYENMSERRSVLHYAYQPVISTTESMLRGGRSVPQVSYVRPTEEELAMMHNRSYMDIGDEFAELTELLTPRANDEYSRAETPMMDESDGEETEWSMTETENACVESEIDESVQINEISSSGIDKSDFDDASEKNNTSGRKRKRSLKLSEKESEDSAEKSSEGDDELDTTIQSTKKRKIAPAKVVRTRYIQTRQADRKTRSKRVFGVENEERSKPFKVRAERVNNKTNKENAESNKPKNSPAQARKVAIQKKLAPVLKDPLNKQFETKTLTRGARNSLPTRGKFLRSKEKRKGKAKTK